MKTLKLGFADTFDTAKKFFHHTLSKRYQVILEDNDPDYLIFGDANFGQSHLRFDRSKVKKIFYTGENVRPNYTECHNAITFDHENSPRHYRMPLYVIDMYGATIENWTNDFFYLVNKKLSDPEKLYDERKFCSYIQSNPRQQVRNMFFDALSTYKKIDAGGPHNNNIGYVIPRDSLKFKLDFCKQYRFNLSFENGSYPGYVTEKIMNAFYSDSIPLYWGSPTVTRDFNPKAFVNAFDFKNVGDMITYIKHLDSPEGKKEYIDMLTQPAFYDNIPNEFLDLARFLDWWDQFVYEV